MNNAPQAFISKQWPGNPPGSTATIREAIRKGSTADFSAIDMTRCAELERKFNRYYRRQIGPSSTLTTEQELDLQRRARRLAHTRNDLTWVACLCIVFSEGL